MIKLRECQTEAISLLRKSLAAGKRSPIIVASCGFGKTITAAAICSMAASKGKRVLFVTPRRGLTFQTEAAFLNYGIDVGVIMAGVDYDGRHMVDVASIDTITSRVDRMSNARLATEAADIIITDECQGSVSDKRAEYFLGCLNGKYGKKKIVIGLTATPCVNGGGGLGRVFDDLVIPMAMKGLIEQGYLVQPRYFSAPRPDISAVKMTAGDYRQNGLGDVYAEKKIMGDIVSNWLAIAKGTTTVIFTPTRANAADLVERFNGIGVSAEYVDANTKDDERQRIFDRVASGKTTIVANVGIISFGTDIPKIQTVVMATATKSIVKWVQAVGRSLRPYEGKDYSIIIDHGGMSIDEGMGPVEDIVDWDLAEKGTVQARSLDRKQDKKEPKDISCVKCKTVFKARRDCPSCGHVMKNKTEAIEYHEAKLTEVKKNNRDMSSGDKRNFFSGLKWYAFDKGYADGWAAHKYKAKTGVWPNKYKEVKMSPPSIEVLNFIKYTQIAYARRA